MGNSFIFNNNEQSFNNNLNYSQENDVANSPVYNRKLAELMAKIGDDSTTMAILNDGTVIAIKMKTVVCTYNWSEEKSDFVSQRGKNMRNRKNHKLNEENNANFDESHEEDYIEEEKQHMGYEKEFA